MACIISIGYCETKSIPAVDLFWNSSNLKSGDSSQSFSLSHSVVGLESNIAHSYRTSKIEKHGAVILNNKSETIFLMGGKSWGTGNPTNWVKSLFLVDKNVLNVLHVSDLPYALEMPSLVHRDKQVIVIPSIEGGGILALTLHERGKYFSGETQIIGQIPEGAKLNTSLMIGNRLLVLPMDGSGKMFSADFSPDGKLNSWRNEVGLPLKRGFSVVGFNDRVYILGGYNKSGEITSEVYSMSCNNKGEFGAWENESSLLEPIAEASVVYYAGLITISGGTKGAGVVTNRIYSNKINRSGHLTKWIKENVTLPYATKNHKMIARERSLYIIGGDGIGLYDYNINRIDYKMDDAFVPKQNAGSIGSYSFPPRGVTYKDRYYYVGIANGESNFYSARFYNSNSRLLFGTGSLIGNPNPGGASSKVPLLLHRDKIIYFEYSTGPTWKLYILEGLQTNPTWKFIGTIPILYTDFTPFLVGDRLYIVGGITISRDITYLNNVYYCTIDEYNTFGPWVAESFLPIKASIISVGTGNGKIVISGGVDSGSRPPLKNLYASYQDENGLLTTWKPIGELPIPLLNYQVLINADKLIISGGFILDGVYKPNQKVYTNTFDDQGMLGPTWEVIPNMTDNGGINLFSINGDYFYHNAVESYKVTEALYQHTGVTYSNIIDLQSVRNIKKITWADKAHAAGATFEISALYSNTESIWKNGFEDVSNGIEKPSLGRYIQLRGEVRSSDGKSTPIIKSFEINHHNDFTNSDGSPIISIVNSSTSSISILLVDRSVGEEAFQFFLSTSSPPTGSPIQYASVVGSSGTAKTFTFDGLLHGTVYYLRARGYNSEDSIDGADSNLLTTQTLSPNLNQRILRDVGDSAVEIRWPTVPNAIEYRVYDENNNLLVTNSSSTLRFTEMGFTQNTPIFRRIEATDNVGVIQVGATTFYTTLKPPTLTDFKIESQGDNWINVSVTPPLNSPLGSSGTKIILRSNGEIVRVARLKNEESSYRFEPLPIGRNYQITTVYLNAEAVETEESPILDIFQGLELEKIEPVSKKFRINEGINFTVESNSPVQGTMKIYDSRQRLLREMEINLPAGNTSIRWDGRDGNGNQVYSGIYWVVTETDHFGRNRFKVAGIR